MKIKLVLLLAVFAVMCGSASAQGFRVVSQVTQRGTVAGATNVVVIPSAPIIKFCNAPANAVPCSNLATTFTDATLVTPCANSTQIVLDGTSTCVSSPDAQNNWGVWIAAGQYAYTITVGGTNFGPYFVTVGGGAAGGLDTQFQFNDAGAQNGATDFTYTKANGTITSINPTLATGGANQSSPIFSIIGNYWNGAASVQDNWTFQIVPAAGVNPVTEYRITPGSSPGGELFHVKTAFTADGQANFGNVVNVQNGFFSAPIQGVVAYQNKGNTPATNVVNVSSGTHKFVGEYWTGAASADDTWTLEDILGTGTNPTSTLSWVHSGSPGQVIASIPGIMYSCGTIAAGGACVPATSGNSHCFSGIAILAGGTSTITAISPAFTNSTSYNVITNDLTTIANPSKGVPASGSSITFTGTGTDFLSFQACGE